MNRAKLRSRLSSAATNRGDRRILSCEISCCDGRSSGRALDRDVDRIEDRGGRTISSIANDNHALNSWQLELRFVLRKVRVEFGDNIILVARQKSRFHVQATARRLHTENSRGRNFSLALQAKNFFHRVDAVAETQQLFDIAAV